MKEKTTDKLFFAELEKGKKKKGGK